MILDVDYDAVIAAHAARREISGTGLPNENDTDTAEWDVAMSVIWQKTCRLYECPECGRLLWEDHTTGEFKCYTPEHPNWYCAASYQAPGRQVGI